MRKRLVLLFCAALVLMVAVPAFAAVQNVKVSGDILTRFIVRDNFDLSKDRTAAPAQPSDEIGVFNSAVRLRVDADLTDNVQTTIRLINERDWNVATVGSTDIDLDLAYVTLKEFLYSPLTVTLGRQELHFGNDMIMGDGVGTPNGNLVSGHIGTNQTTNYPEAIGLTTNGDLALRKSFDAVRATLDYDPLVIDVVYAKIDANVITGSSSNDDIDLWGLNAGYKFSDKWNTFAEGYIWDKIDRVGFSTTLKDKKTDTTYTIGARVSTNPNAKLNLQQEMAYQFGEKVVGTNDGRERSAWASQTMATLTPGWKHNPVIGLVYSYFSGDARLTSAANPDKKYHQWDPMFENQTAGHIINALFASSNAHNIDASLTLKPSFLEDITLRTDYVYLLLAKGMAVTSLFAAANDYSAAGNTYKVNTQSLGQELDLNLIYDYTEDVQIGLLTAWFWPGYTFTNAGVRGQTATATETIVSCNVKF